MRLQRPTPQCPPPCGWPGSPCSHQGHRSADPRVPSGWRRRSSPWRGRSSATKGPHRAGELGSDRRSLLALGTKDQSGRRPRCNTEAGPDPLKAEPDPRAGRAPGRRAGWLRTAGGLWRPPTYLSLRCRWLRVAACQPRGRAPEPHTGPTRAAPPPRPVRAPAAPTHWAGPRPPGPFKPGPYHRAGRGRPGRAGWPGARAGAAPAPGPHGGQRAAPNPRSHLGPRPASGPPPRLAQWPRPRDAPLPLLPARRLPQPWDPRAPAPHPPRARRAAAPAHKPRPARALRGASRATCCRGAAAPVPTCQARTGGGRRGPCSGHSRPRGP